MRFSEGLCGELRDLIEAAQRVSGVAIFYLGIYLLLRQEEYVSGAEAPHPEKFVTVRA